MVFTDNDINGTVKCPIHLEQTWPIVKYPAGRFAVDTYQFRHLAFQEFLSPLYLCLVKGVSKYNMNRELSSCNHFGNTLVARETDKQIIYGLLSKFK